MPKATLYVAQQRPDGFWEFRREGKNRDPLVFVSKSGAWEFTKDVARQERGDAVLKALNGDVLERKPDRWYHFLPVI